MSEGSERVWEKLGKEGSGEMKGRVLAFQREGAGFLFVRLVGFFFFFFLMKYFRLDSMISLGLLAVLKHSDKFLCGYMCVAHLNLGN